MTEKDIRAEMLATRDELLKQHPEITEASELALLLPKHLQAEYWEWRLEHWAAQHPLNPRRFYLQRHHDVTGTSGSGRVADGVLWPDGTATIRWRGEHQSTVHWDRIDSAERVHGHGGATEIVWIDSEEPL